MKKILMFSLPMVLAFSITTSAQTVLYQEKFDEVDRAGRPAGWVYTPGWFHTLESQPNCGDSVHPGIPESTNWGNPEVDWQVTEIKRVGMYDATRGTDCIRDYWCTYALDSLGNPIPDALVSPIMPSAELFQESAPDANSTISRTRAGGTTAPWVTSPYPNFGCDPKTGVVDEKAKVLISDSDEYGGVNYNAAITTPAIDLKGSKYARIEYKYMVEQNQDCEFAGYYKIDNGPWQTLQRFSMHYHGDDFNYLADVSFVVKTEGGSKLSCLWYNQGNFSWYFVLDDFTVKGYSDVPADGPAKPEAVSPMETIEMGKDVTLKASSYQGAKPHAFSQWQIREADGTYGQLTNYSSSSFLEAYPVVETGIQPNHYCDGAYITREGNIWSGALIKGRPNPAAQLRVPIGQGFDPKNEQIIPADMLRPGVTYYWRVCYWDETYKASAWSDEKSFTVRAIPGTVLLTENFDEIKEPDKTDGGDTSQIPKGWSGTFSQTGWDVCSLGVYQLFGNSPASAFDAVSGNIEPGLSCPNLTESDGRGHHGRFKNNVLITDEGSLNDATTPTVDNSKSNQPLYLLFDAQVRTSNDSVAFAVEMTDSAGTKTPVYSFANISADYASSVLGGRTNPVIYTISPAVKVDLSAGKKVSFTFYSSENDGGDDYVSLDNIEVIQYNPAASIMDWELQD